MKKLSISLLFAFLSLSAIAQWNFVGPAGTSGGWTTPYGIVTNSSGSPVALFHDEYLRKTQLLSYNGIQWDSVGNSTIDSFYIGNILGFEIDKDDNYCIAFRNNVNFLYSCIRFDGSEWKYVGSQYISTDMGQQIGSMALDTAGVVYIVSVTEEGCKILKENDGNWVPVTTNGLPQDLGFNDLEFDKDNVAYLGFGEYSSVKCAKLLSSTWVQVGNTISLTYWPWYVKLNIAKNHDLYIVFDIQNITCYKLKDQTSNWEILGVPGLGGNYLNSGDLTSDSNSNIIISNEPMSGDRARCFLFDGKGWIQLGDSGISESYAGSVKIAINQYDNLYVAYHDQILGAVVKEYSRPTDIDPVSFYDPLKIYPNPVKDLFYVELTGQEFSITIVDTKGNLVYCNTSITDKLEIPTEDFGKGIYIVRIISGKSSTLCRKLVVN